MTRINSSLKIALTSSLLLLFLLSLIINVKLVKSSKLPTIDLVNKVEFNQDFDCRHIAFDDENHRLFISNNGIKMYNVSEPMNIELLSSISNQSHAIMNYHNGYLFSIYFTYQGQRIRVYSVSLDNEFQYVNQSEPFDYTSGNDNGVKYMYFPSNDLMITCGAKIRLWDISDLNNITCLSDYFFDDLLYGGSFGEQVSCTGIAFHPDEDKFLINVNYVQTGQIFLVDYSNPSNLVVIDFNLDSFETNQSALKIATKYSIISNNYFPCFTTDAYLETINWQNASEPIFRSRFKLPQGDDPLLKIKLTLYDENKVLVYRKISGIIDVSEPDNNGYITEFNTSRSIYSYYQPIIKDNFIFCLNWKTIIGEGSTYYISVWNIKSTNSSTGSLWPLSFITLIPVPFIVGYLVKKRRR